MEWLNDHKEVSALSIVAGIVLLIIGGYHTFKHGSFLFSGVTTYGELIGQENCVKKGKNTSRVECNLILSYADQSGVTHQLTTEFRHDPTEEIFEIKYSKDNPEIAKFMTVDLTIILFMLIVGAIATIGGFIFFNKAMEQYHIEERIKKEGAELFTEFVDVELLGGGGEYHVSHNQKTGITTETYEAKKYYIIHTQWEDPQTGRVVKFKSKKILNRDPKAKIQLLLNKQPGIRVWVNPMKPEEYLMDISFVKS